MKAIAFHQCATAATGTSAICTASANSSAIPPKRTYEVLLLSVYETGGRALIEGCAAKEWRNRHCGRNLSACWVWSLTTWSALTTLFSPIFFVSVLGNFGGLADA